MESCCLRVGGKPPIKYVLITSHIQIDVNILIHASCFFDGFPNSPRTPVLIGFFSTIGMTQVVPETDKIILHMPAATLQCKNRCLPKTDKNVFSSQRF